MDFNSSNRHKFTGTSVTVMRNSEWIQNSNTGAYIESRERSDRYFNIALDDIDGVIEALKSVQSDYKALEPKNSDILDALPIGSAIQVMNEPKRFFKGVDGNWSYAGQPRNEWAPGGYEGVWFDNHGWDINVKYNPNEEAN